MKKEDTKILFNIIGKLRWALAEPVEVIEARKEVDRLLELSNKMEKGCDQI